MFNKNIIRAGLEQIMQDDSLGRVWLIYWGDEAIGYIVLTFGYSLEFHGRDALVDELYIREEYRRSGIGTKALQFVEEICCSLGLEAIHLVVERKDAKAQSFYRQLGFEEQDPYLMTKSFLPSQ